MVPACLLLLFALAWNLLRGRIGRAMMAVRDQPIAALAMGIFTAMSQCDAFGLSPTEAAAEAAAVIGVVNTWQAHFAQAGVTARDIAGVAERIDGEVLLSQRSGFDPARFQASTAKRKKTEPIQAENPRQP